jgi:cyclopropane fatty-acyl-phospholipid synthase-like methyltransferase
MDIVEKTKLAAAFGAPPEILPYIPELLADLWSLGIPPGAVVNLVRPLNFQPDSTRVLDLGCGKGAIAITLAHEFGFRVLGVDIFPPFIENARQRARDLGVEGICQFEHGDMRKWATETGNYDIVVLVWTGGVLGDIGKSVRKLRNLVHTGGYMVLSEGYRRGGVPVDLPYLKRFSHQEMILQNLTAHGDTLVREMVVPEDEIKELYGDYIDSLNKGAHRSARNHPEHADLLWEYMKAQEEMCRIMESAVVSGVWLLRKN